MPVGSFPFHFGPAFACVLFASSATRAAPAHPPDPFASEYVVPDERDVGTTAGQVRFMASPVVGVASQGTSLGGELTLEGMTIALVGIRSTLQGDVHHAANDPGLFAARIGPALHLLPYHRVDLSLFVEGGVARVSQLRSEYVPMLSPGLDVDLWLTSSWFVHVGGHLDWLSLDGQGYLRASATAGLGLGF